MKNFVFTARHGEVVVQRHYKPSSSLCVSQATRKQFAESCYDFGTVCKFDDPNTFFKYLSSITPAHRALVNAVQLTVKRRMGITAKKSRKEWADKKIRIWKVSSLRRILVENDDHEMLGYSQ
jgi:hypothetical protein